VADSRFAQGAEISTVHASRLRSGAGEQDAHTWLATPRPRHADGRSVPATCVALARNAREHGASTIPDDLPGPPTATWYVR
jgi:hypothetical protein